MSSFTNSKTGQPFSLAQVSSGSGAVLGSIAVLLAATLALMLSVPPVLLLPSVALAATVLAVAIGLVAWKSSGRMQAGALTSAGIFALAAIATGMLGDPDQVALYFK